MIVVKLEMGRKTPDISGTQKKSVDNSLFSSLFGDEGGLERHTAGGLKDSCIAFRERGLGGVVQFPGPMGPDSLTEQS